MLAMYPLVCAALGEILIAMATTPTWNVVQRQVPQQVMPQKVLIILE